MILYMPFKMFYQGTKFKPESAQIDAQPNQVGKRGNHLHKLRPSCNVVNSTSNFSLTFRETEI